MKIQYASATPFPDGRHPLTAALLSFIPGLGQMYVGEKRKGVLYLHVAFINAVLLSLCLFAQQIYVSVTAFSSAYHMHVNEDAASSLKQLEFGSPASVMLFLLCLAFVLYCAREAYDAAYLKRRQIYKDFVLQLPEAGSYSYITHFALMMCFAIMALFFIAAPKHSIQEITIIDLNENVPVAKPKQPTQNVAKHAAQENGRITNKSDLPKTAASRPAHEQPVHPRELPSASSASQAAPAAPVPQPRAQVRTPTPVARPLPTQQAVNPQPAQPMPVPIPRPTSAANAPSPVAPAPAPQKQLVAMANLPGSFSPLRSAAAGQIAAPPVPQATSSLRSGGPSVAPSAIKFGGNNQIAGAPAPNVGGSKGSNSNGMPAPVSASEGTGTPSGPPTSPVATQTGSHQGPGGPGSNGVTPRKANSSPFGGKDGDRLAVVPNVDGGPGVHSIKDGPGPESKNSIEGPPDFAKYMADLQRRIRKHWFPPHDPNSRLAVVTFTIARDGSLSNVRLTHSTGDQRADDAAVQAVQDSAPLPSLPEHSPPSVDIEFTFTYQVFGQDGMHFRRL